MIYISGQEFGGLTTRDEFHDYHLVAEWKWGERTWAPRKEKARDSGILLHCVGPDGAAGGNWMQSQECQIIEGGCGDFIMVPGQDKPSLTCETRSAADGQWYFEKGGSPSLATQGVSTGGAVIPSWKDILGFRGRRDVEKPAGEWNRMEVICDWRHDHQHRQRPCRQRRAPGRASPRARSSFSPRGPRSSSARSRSGR